MEIDLLSVLGAGGWGLFAGWVLPAGIATAGVAYGVLPSTGLHHDFTRHLSILEQAVVLAFAAFVVGVLLNAVQVPLYRLVEGHSFPQWYRQWRGRHYISRRNRLREKGDGLSKKANELRKQADARLTQADERHDGNEADKLRKKAAKLRTKAAQAEGVEQGLLLERRRRYPKADDEVLATRLGNAIRALEEYAFDRYGLDSITMWSELHSVVPAALREELERARAPVDFCVAALYLSLLIGVGLVPLGIVHKDWLWFAGTAAGMLLAFIWYELAIGRVSYWYITNQAMVNLGRVPLASALGLPAPSTLGEERTMWEAVMEFVQEGEVSEQLDSYRHASTLRRIDDQPEEIGTGEQPDETGTDARPAQPNPIQNVIFGAGLGFAAASALRLLARRLGRSE